MTYLSRISVIPLTSSLPGLTSPAWADFWSDAEAKYKGVVLHGVTESTPPSSTVRNLLAPGFEKRIGIEISSRSTAPFK